MLLLCPTNANQLLAITSGGTQVLKRLWCGPQSSTVQRRRAYLQALSFCEIELPILLDFEDSVFDVERIVRDDRFGVDIEDDVHLIGIFVGGT